MFEKVQNEDIEIQLFLEALYLKYGYDFRGYSRAHIKRRIRHRLVETGVGDISQLQHKLLYDPDFVHAVLLDFSVNVTEMFRDPDFYHAVRDEVVPRLLTYPALKIWHAGCSTGEEVYSMAILMKEEDVFHRSRIYATDFNEVIVSKAKEGIYPVEHIKAYTTNYVEAGGKESLADYYTAEYQSVIMNRALRQQILFSAHNLVTDSVFGEMNMIVCRNVLIYFSKDLQERVLKLFLDSLRHGGFLCLGSKESVQFSRYASRFETISEEHKIYRKVVL